MLSLGSSSSVILSSPVTGSAVVWEGIRLVLVPLQPCGGFGFEFIDLSCLFLSDLPRLLDLAVQRTDVPACFIEAPHALHITGIEISESDSECTHTVLRAADDNIPTD